MVRQHEPKCAESREPVSALIREEKKREEEKRGAGARRRPFDPGEYHELHPVVAAVLERFESTFQSALGRRYVRRGHGDMLGAGRLAHWAEGYAAINGGDPVELGARVAGNFVSARSRGGQPPAMSWLDPDSPRHPMNPDAWLTTSDAPASGVRAARGPRAVSPAHAHAAAAAAAGPLIDDTGDDFDGEVAV